jgi:dGTPase
MDGETLKKLVSVRGCLKHMATGDDRVRRRHPPEEDNDGWLIDLGSPYDIDSGKLLCSKAIRRLSNKTQVVTRPANSHTRSRRVHTDEVVSAATTIARVLGLNESLCRAGALGHDIGHTPFGHAGEDAIAHLSGRKFRHEVMSVVIAQHIERKGRGLNLTRQTLECMLYHSRGSGEFKASGISPEADAVMFADKISYLFSDFNDLFVRQAYTGSRFRLSDFLGLSRAMDLLGRNQRERMQTCITAICMESADKGRVSFKDSEAARLFNEAKKMMYEAYGRIPKNYQESILGVVHQALKEAVDGVDPALMLALLTDDDVVSLALASASGAVTQDDLERLSIGDILPHIKGRNIDFTDPDLEW